MKQKHIKIKHKEQSDTKMQEICMWKLVSVHMHSCTHAHVCERESAHRVRNMREKLRERMQRFGEILSPLTSH